MENKNEYVILCMRSNFHVDVPNSKSYSYWTLRVRTHSKDTGSVIHTWHW